MTTHANNHLPVTWPAILATFYYANRDGVSADKKTPPLVKYLQKKLKLSQDTTAEIETWKGSNQDEKISFDLTCFTPIIPHATDVKIVQLVLGDIREDRAATLVWPKMLYLLEPLLNDDTLKSIFGYTLTYQAVIPDPRAPTPTLSDVLLPAQLRRIVSGNSTPPTQTFSSLLAHVNLRGC